MELNESFGFDISVNACDSNFDELRSSDNYTEDVLQLNVKELNCVINDSENVNWQEQLMNFQVIYNS